MIVVERAAKLYSLFGALRFVFREYQSGLLLMVRLLGINLRGTGFLLLLLGYS